MSVLCGCVLVDSLHKRFLEIDHELTELGQHMPLEIRVAHSKIINLPEFRVSLLLGLDSFVFNSVIVNRYTTATTLGVFGVGPASGWHRRCPPSSRGPQIRENESTARNNYHCSFLWSALLYNHDFYTMQIIVVTAKPAAEPAA